MKELPKLQQIADGLREELAYRYIDSIELKTSRESAYTEYSAGKAEGQKIIDINRYGKYIQFQLSTDAIMVYMGDDGVFSLFHDNTKCEDAMLTIKTESGRLCFNGGNDARCLFIGKDAEYLPKVGVDPLTKQFNFNYFYGLLSESDLPVMEFLTNQQVVSGIGEKYASQILEASEIDKTIRAREIGKRKAREFFWNVKVILREAVEEVGSSAETPPEEEYGHSKMTIKKSIKKQESGKKKHSSHKVSKSVENV